MIKLNPWRVGMGFVLIGAGISIADYIGYFLNGPLPLPNFIGFILGWGLICFTLGLGIAWGINANYKIEKVEDGKSRRTAKIQG